MTNSIIEFKNLDFSYKQNQVVFNINAIIRENQVTAFIGPSGCGKSTILRCINRIHDLYDYPVYGGEILFHGEDILKEKDLITLRTRIGMVFQKPTAFPISIYENVAYGLRMKGIKDKKILDEKVELALRNSALWDFAKDKLKQLGTELSGGQQQRLCIARALAPEPEVILFDEPTSALDPVSTAQIENFIQTIKKKVTVVIVTHSMQQAARISDRTAFFLDGELLECDTTDNIFTNPQDQRTEDYISGRF